MNPLSWQNPSTSTRNTDTYPSTLHLIPQYINSLTMRALTTASSLAKQIRLRYSKDNIYKNRDLIFNMNQRLEFPFSFLKQQFDEEATLLLQAIRQVDTLEIVNEKTLRLKYPGSMRVVIVKGVRREAIEQILHGIHGNERKKIMKYSLAQGSSVFETESQEAASWLKKYFRVQKKKFDASDSSNYKINISSKVRIIIEGQELYTLLLDHLFEEERRFLILQQLNTDDIIIQPITGPNYLEYGRREESDSDISDITSRCSDGYSSRNMKEIIETSDTGTQLNEAISEDPAKREFSSSEKIFEQEYEEDGDDEDQGRRQDGGECKSNDDDEDVKDFETECRSKQDEVRPKNISLVIPPFTIQAGEQQEIEVVEKQRVYSYQAMMGIYDEMIDNDQIQEPETFRKHAQISAKNESHQRFLDSIYKKISGAGKSSFK